MRFLKRLLFVFFICFLCACSKSINVKSISKIDNTYIVEYSDGKIETFEIENEKVNIDDLYNFYIKNNPDGNYDDFINQFEINNDYSHTINKALKSSMKVYTEFIMNYKINQMYNLKDTALSSGSAVIYKIDNDYTYIITNYHVVYNYNSLTDDKIAKKITCYLYGSEDNPIVSKNKDINGYTLYEYGNYGIDCEYVGGSINYDLAIIKAKTDDILKINKDISSVEFSKGYHVGEVAIAIGNSKDEGISATQGIVSVLSEYISLAIDNNIRDYRSIRVDSAIYSGNSGGGLFNRYGELIGITNAGAVENQNINYAIPVEIVKNVSSNILLNKKPRIIKLGIEIKTENTKFLYDEKLGYGKIVEDLIVNNVIDDSIASKIGIKKNDILLQLIINWDAYDLNKDHDISDLILSIKEKDTICFKYKRNDNIYFGNNYIVKNDDLNIEI